MTSGTMTSVPRVHVQCVKSQSRRLELRLIRQLQFVFVDPEQLAIEAACEFVSASVLPCLEMIPALNDGERRAGKTSIKVIDRSLTRPTQGRPSSKPSTVADDQRP
jgi:hypothetical protein